MKTGCPLNYEFSQLIDTSPKLYAILKLLVKYKEAGVLILSSFTEMILIIERVSPLYSLCMVALFSMTCSILIVCV